MTDTPPRTGEQLDIDAIEARANAATKGPWGGADNPAFPNGNGVWFVQLCPRLSIASPSMDSADVKFIAHAREDVPALVAEVRRLRAACVQNAAAAVAWKESCKKAQETGDKLRALLGKADATYAAAVVVARHSDAIGVPALERELEEYRKARAEVGNG